MKIITGLFICLLLSLSGYSQDCEVKLESVTGKYEGDCKKGLANGKGKSVGIDTYDGEFKKGLPSGQGTYTWSNGDIYIGEFKKGLKFGKGKLTSGIKVDEGYWYEDDFIGKESKPYKTMNQDNTIAKISAQRKNADTNKVDIVYQRLGRKVSYKNIKVTNQIGSFGSLIQNPFMKSIQAVKFPFRFLASGDDNFDMQINQGGHWVVTVDLIKKLEKKD